MGARIRTEGRVAVIDGVDRLYGASVVSPDLRGGSALVLAGLTATGITEVSDIKHIDRGYENFEENLCMLNADIVRTNGFVRFLRPFGVGVEVARFPVFLADIVHYFVFRRVDG